MGIVGGGEEVSGVSGRVGEEVIGVIGGGEEVSGDSGGGGGGEWG